MKYSNFSIRILYKYFRHIRSYEQFINKYILSFFCYFLLFAAIFIFF